MLSAWCMKMFCPKLTQSGTTQNCTVSEVDMSYIDWSSSSADTEAVPVLPTKTFHCCHEICHILHSGTYVALYLTCIQHLRENSYSPRTHNAGLTFLYVHLYWYSALNRACHKVVNAVKDGTHEGACCKKQVALVSCPAVPAMGKDNYWRIPSTRNVSDQWAVLLVMYCTSVGVTSGFCWY